MVMTLEDAIARRFEALIGRRSTGSTIEAFLPRRRSRLRRSALASSFVAALELARQGRVELCQDEAFAPLYLRPARSIEAA